MPIRNDHLNKCGQATDFELSYLSNIPASCLQKILVSDYQNFVMQSSLNVCPIHTAFMTNVKTYI